jgi:molybdopterin-guanine dinucleotide biosynthesis protein B
MLSPRAVSVVGFKASGKTRVVEALVRELTRRGHRVGTLKHTSDDVVLDTPGKDTWRHREAGSVATAILESGRGAFFIDRPMGVEEAVEVLGTIDFVVLEGFKSLDTVARVIVPREREEIGELSNGLEIAISGPAVEGLSVESEVPAIPLDRAEGLADVVEEKAFPLLPRMDCGGCGYEDCRSLAEAIVAGEADAERCVGYSPGGVRLRINGRLVPMNAFVRSTTKNVVMGLVRSLKGVEEPDNIELEIRAGEERDG